MTLWMGLMPIKFIVLVKLYNEINVLNACTINAHKVSEEILLRTQTQVEKW